MSRIQEAFKGKKAFIPFVTCGDPDLETTKQIVYEMEKAGAALIELGIPFSDPTAEGPVIQGANLRALTGGVTTDKIFDMVKEMMPLAEIYVHEVDNANQIDGFIGLNNDYIEGIFIKDVAQSKGIGKQLLDQVKKIRTTLKLNVYQKNERAIQFYLREEFSILSECVDDNTGEKEFTMVWKR